jgi:RNA polymerase subunit RPABC4/transcription elongation factor Spt4
MSEENKNRCPKCDVGKLRTLMYRATESDGRNWKNSNLKICQLCKTIITNDDEINFVYQNW